MVKSMTFIAMVTEYLVTSKRKQGYCNNNENSLPSVVHVKVTQITLIAERQDVWNLAQVQGDRLFLPYPRLLPRFYGEMVEHLKVPPHSLYTLLLKIFHQMHHPSCHGDSEKGVVQQILLLLQQARSRGRGKSRSPTERRPRRCLTSTWTLKVPIT